MAKMNWKEIEEPVRQNALVLFPTGVIEEHGPHLSLAVDTLCSYTLSKQIKNELEKLNIYSIISPPYYWGINNATGGFPGSFTVRKETLRNIITDILLSLHRWGFKNIFIVNWHGDKEHIISITDGIRNAWINFGVKAFIILTEFEIERLKLSQKEPFILSIREENVEKNYVDIHAGPDEVSIILNYYPDHVNQKIAETLKPTNLTKKDIIIWNRGWSDTRTLIPEGYFGNPNDFSKENGKAIIEKKSKLIAEIINNFLK